MPFVWRDKKGRPKFTVRAQLTKMTMAELIAYEKFLWECMEKLPNSPHTIVTLNALHREVEWRAQDPEFPT